MTIPICLTIDVERRTECDQLDGIRSDLSKILGILKPVSKATFFVTGEVAEKFPDVIRSIGDEGYEVGCHGLYHERFDVLESGEQIRRIEVATRYITEALGVRPFGFRAPEHRANGETILALEKLQYLYDSSVIPRTPFMRPQAYKKWRFLFAPTRPYFPSRNNIARHGDSTLVELPVSTFFLPFVSKLSMRSGHISDTVATFLTYRAKLFGAPIIYYLHSYDSYFCKDLDWLQRVIRTLQKHDVEFLTMNQLAVEYKDKMKNSR
ncbi:MAG TPA: polysaccharide deacetylase family protein [Candidatus Bathyarchaeia archaeon]|nr:polysaccharide deacetylase family protein [Candidatus Bathyarchaeia archaeon]